MIAQVHRSGKSFRSAAEYCLGDKVPERNEDEKQERRKPQEGDPSWKNEIKSDRVAWTQTLNLATDNPYKAARMMAATVSYAPSLKQESGIKSGGRELAKPVYHFTLSWKEGERPGRNEMVSAIRSSLRTLHVEDRQALLVAHRDTTSAHVHVIVNRVSHDDGRAANLGRDRRTLSRWAERYERYRGKVQCPRRVAHNRRRAAGEKKVYENKYPSNATYHRSKKEPSITRRTFTEKPSRPPARFEITRSAAEKQVWNRCKNIYQTARAELDNHHREQWRELYKHYKTEAEKIKNFTASGDLDRYVKQEQRDWKGSPEDAPTRETVIDDLTNKLKENFRSDRADYARSQRAEVARLTNQAQVYYTTQTAPIAAHDSTLPYLTHSGLELAREALAAAAGDRQTAPSGTNPEWNPFEEEEEKRRRERGMER